MKGVKFIPVCHKGISPDRSFGSGTVAGGVSGGPPDQANIIEWLQASKINQADGTSVATWPHTLGFDGTASGTAQPTLKLGIQNGLPIVRFNGTTNVMSTNSSLGTKTNYCAACAFRYTGPLSGSVCNVISLNGTGVVGVTGGGQFVANGVAQTALADNNFHIFIIFWTTNNVQWSFDGAALQSTGSGAGSLNLILEFSDSGSPAASDIGECIVWGTDETANFAGIYNYMNGQWA